MIVRAYDLHIFEYGPPTLVCIMWNDRYVKMADEAIIEARNMRDENGF